ncbi:MAG: NADH-quinone oxidoreductase subunit D [Planctomycetota bacterium]|nr:MAG: NADH-quinone oxidoreductase subunit D [Planctomycetota bacterium]
MSSQPDTTGEASGTVAEAVAQDDHAWLLNELHQRFAAEGDEQANDQGGVIIPIAHLEEALRFLRDNDRVAMRTLLDITAIDYLAYPNWYQERFAVVYQLCSLDALQWLRLKVMVEEDEAELPTVSQLFPIADWLEREVWDQYGIRFQGHPNLKRLLNHHQFEGHPLRKDYPVQRRQHCSHNDPMIDQLRTALIAQGYEPIGAEDELSKVRTRDGHEIDIMTINLGPSHPATHGTLRIFAALDGETILASTCEMGYLHRGFEKMVEQGTYAMVLPYTDRLNYCSAITNNIGFCKAVEDMFGVEIPERCVTIRVILTELSRIIDHLVCVGANLVDLGALTNFWYFFNPREEVYRIWEKLCGARLTNTFTRIGGLYRDAYEGFSEDVRAVLPRIEAAVAEVLRLVERNKIFIDRTQDVGVVSAERAIAWGWTGPCLRASGVDHDLRKKTPYYGYETYDFETVIGTTGDCYDRAMVRVYEIGESAKIIRQALDRLRPGPFNTSDARLSLPQKMTVYQDMEALINQFKLIYEGVRPPPGEFYSGTEAANGELGFFVVSDGGTNPYKIKVRSPCFTQWASYSEMVQGELVADAMGACLGSINIIAGELDR